MITAIHSEPDKPKVVHTPRHITAAEIASILDRHRTTIVRRSEAENWPFIEAVGNGGTQKLFALATLPVDIQQRVRIHYGEIPAELVGCVPLGWDKNRIERCAKVFGAAKEWQKQWAQDRMEILGALERHRADRGTRFLQKAGSPDPSGKNSHVTGKERPRNRREATEQFAKLYRQRRAPYVNPEIYDRVRKVSATQLYEWKSRFEDSGIAGLLSKNGWSAGTSTVPQEQQQFVLAAIVRNPDLRAGHISNLLRHQFGDAAATSLNVRRFIKQQRERDPSLFCLLDNPDRWRSKHDLRLGDASEKATHFLHYVEVDSTPADVMCADGRRYNIAGLIDVFSRKCKFLVTPTSSSWAIAGLIRETILDWGLPENIVRDNGRDYAAEKIREALQALEVAEVVLPPFTPRGKPHIERVFGTLNRDLMPTLPGFIGANVTERKAIEARKSFAERMGKAGAKKQAGKPAPQGTGETSPDSRVRGNDGIVGLTPEELQAAINTWTEQVYHQRPHGTLGMSPNAKASSVPHRPLRIDDARALDMLMTPASRKGIRTVLADGVHHDNGKFWNDGLIPYIGRKVYVRLDVRNAGRIFCFDPSTKEFICEAVDLALGELTVGDYNAARKRAAKDLRQREKAIKTIAKSQGDPLAAAIKAIREDAGTVTNLPVGEPVTDNPHVDAAFAAANAMRAQEEEEEERKSRGTGFLPEAGSPDPSGKDSNVVFPDMERRGKISTFSDDPDGSLEIERQRMIYVDGPEWPINQTGTKKVLKLSSRNKEQVERLLFVTPREKYEHLRREQRGRELTEDEIRWLQTFIDDWFDIADMFCEHYPEEDQRWLGKIAPSHFPQYAEEETK